MCGTFWAWQYEVKLRMKFLVIVTVRGGVRNE